MRGLLLGAMNGAADMAGKVLDEVQGFTDGQAVTRYVLEHKGDPRAILAFTQQMAPRGVDVVEQAVLYENEMERLLRNNRGGV